MFSESKPLTRRIVLWMWHSAPSFILGAMFIVLFQYGSAYFESIPIPMDLFPEPAWRTPNTLDARVVASTPFARFEIHKVKTESGAIIDDWLWTDERSHVNILVHLRDQDKYLLFRQTKYGLSKPKLAPVGGLFNEGETPQECAERELLEETGLVSNDWVYLGDYRVQVNRGGGILHNYYARNSYKPNKVDNKSLRGLLDSIPIPAGKTNATSSTVKYSRKLSSHINPSTMDTEYEHQDVQLMTRSELINSIFKFEVGEAQWLSCISSALLYEEFESGKSL